MKENLEKIDIWLKGNASKIFDFSLQKPAKETELNQLENLVGLKITEDFKDLYLWHNGLNEEENVGSLFFGMDFFSIEKIIEEFRNRRVDYADKVFPLKNFDKQIDPSNIYNLNWVKFAFDGARTGLYLDLAPSNFGKYGQVIFIDKEYETGILVADSISELVSVFSNDLENNLYFLDEGALEDGNHFLVIDQKIDIINWQSSEKWKR